MSLVISPEELEALPEERRARRARVLLTLGLVLTLLGLREVTGRLRLLGELRASHPSRTAVARALASADAYTVSVGLGCLARLPPGAVEELLDGAPFGRGLPLDVEAVAVLRARGDAAARRSLERISSPTLRTFRGTGQVLR